jgi:hypothetical protein
MTSVLSIQDAPAILSGLVAAGSLAATPLFRSRRMILFAQLAAGLGFTAHYGLLGIPVAAAVNLLGSVQTGAALLSAKSTAMHRLGYALIFLMAMVGLWFWQGPISGLSVVAMTLIALARMQTHQLRLRLLLLAGGCVWLIHNCIGEAWIALVANTGAVLMGAAALFFMLVRVTIELRPPPASQAAAAA